MIRTTRQSPVGDELDRRHVADKTKKPKNDRMTIMVQSIYVFPLSLFNYGIATESPEIIKQKLDH